MVAFVQSLGPVSTSHTITAAHQDELLEAYTAVMASRNEWPDDGQGGKVQPTAAEVAQWLLDVWIPEQMRTVVRTYKRRRDMQAAAAQVTEIDITKG